MDVYLFIIFLGLVTTGKAQIMRSIMYHEGKYGESQTFIVNKDEEIIINYPSTAKMNPYRIIANSSEAKIAYPVLVVVRQEKQVTSWEIPMVINNRKGLSIYGNTARTLCYSPEEYIQQYYSSLFDKLRRFSISLSTACNTPISVTVKAQEVIDYFIKDNVNYSTQISTTEPSFYYYSFKGKDNTSSVLITLDSMLDVCITVSIQNSLCPVRDLNKDIEYEGKFQDMTTKGALTIPKIEFPKGFFLVFVAKPDGYVCSPDNAILPAPNPLLLKPQNRTVVNFKIRPSATLESIRAAVLYVFGIYLAFCFIVVGVFLLFYRFGKMRKLRKSLEDEDEIDDVSESPVKLTSFIYKSEVMLSDLVQLKKINERKSFNYLWHIMNVSLFYGIPVVQLMVSYQRAVYLSGDIDICYHNFYCAHPLGGMTDFNHIYSNIGYIMVGILFLIFVAFRQKFVPFKKNHGVPQYYGLFYSMGMALITEGILSACYHICPNQSNYQFDTSFMYVMAVLCTIKLFENRHPDMNASAYATFAVIGFGVFIAMFGILSSATFVMIIFVLCYISLCIYLSFKIYFFGEVLEGIKNFINDVKDGENIWDSLRPLRKGNFLLLLAANLCNYTMAALGVYLYPSKTDFATFLLALLMGNTILHMTFYLSMKLFSKEKICLEASLYGILALLCWASASIFFFNNSTEWDVSPAESKRLNNECLIFNFYDQHDIWHMLSAPALLFSFMLLMCVDDDLADVPQNEIKVF